MNIEKLKELTDKWATVKCDCDDFTGHEDHCSWWDTRCKMVSAFIDNKRSSRGLLNLAEKVKATNEYCLHIPLALIIKDLEGGK